jgi:hypothetical protein
VQQQLVDLTAQFESLVGNCRALWSQWRTRFDSILRRVKDEPLSGIRQWPVERGFSPG